MGQWAPEASGGFEEEGNVGARVLLFPCWKPKNSAFVQPPEEICRLILNCLFAYCSMNLRKRKGLKNCVQYARLIWVSCWIGSILVLLGCGLPIFGQNEAVQNFSVDNSMKNCHCLLARTTQIHSDRTGLKRWPVTTTGRVWIFVYTVDNCGESWNNEQLIHNADCPKHKQTK